VLVAAAAERDAGDRAREVVVLGVAGAQYRMDLTAVTSKF
jgi:hypothetical protein